MTTAREILRLRRLVRRLRDDDLQMQIAISKFNGGFAWNPNSVKKMRLAHQAETRRLLKVPEDKR